MLSADLIMVLDGVTTTTGMVTTDQFVQVNYLRSLIQKEFTDKIMDMVIKQ